MSLGSLHLLHVMAGAGVATALYVTTAPGRPMRAFLVVSALLFWPLYLPILLGPRDTPTGAPLSTRPRPKPPPPDDELTQAIVQADAELSSALHGLQGW